jgi:hypothetical protein
MAPPACASQRSRTVRSSASTVAICWATASYRRARIVTLTDAGEARHAAARADIRAMEDELLENLSAAERTRLRRTLAGLG